VSAFSVCVRIYCKPGELGADFWIKLVGFGAGPVLGLVASVFPEFTDFIFSGYSPESLPSSDEHYGRSRAVVFMGEAANPPRLRKELYRKTTPDRT
jgi:hypothetical protein